MKAWWIYIPDEWGEFIHADTKGKAKVLIMHEFGVEEYTYLNAIRIPGLDNKAFTYSNLVAANWNFIDENGYPEKELKYISSCRCSICKETK